MHIKCSFPNSVWDSDTNSEFRSEGILAGVCVMGSVNNVCLFVLGLFWGVYFTVEVTVSIRVSYVLSHYRYALVTSWLPLVSYAVIASIARVPACFQHTI